MPVTDRTLALQRQIDDAVDRIVDTHTRELVRAWADAWDEVAPDLTATLLDMLTAGDRVTRTQLLRSTRLRKVLAVIADRLEQLGRDAGVRIIGDLQGIIDTAGSAQASVIDSQIPPGSGLLDDLDTWSRVDQAQIDAIVRRSTEQITALTRPLADEAYQIVRRELIRGVAAGSNPRATAARMVRRAETAGFNLSLNRALTIARTETLDAHRAAAQLGQAQHTDVLQGWMWVAALSERTCPACLAMNGTVHDLTEPGPLGHQQCRCARVPTVKPWSELGIDGIDEPPSLVPDSAAFFESLTAAQQKTILGTTRYDAWVAGRFPMNQWATRRTTPGWRDSYVVGSPSAGRASLNAA